VFFIVIGGKGSEVKLKIEIPIPNSIIIINFNLFKYFSHF